MLTPYQFASNSPVMAIDLDGLEGVWYHFFEAGVTFGDVQTSQGLAAIVQSGAAYDDAGETHFTIHSLVNPFTEPENSGSEIRGIELGASFSVKYDKRTSFIHSLNGFETNPGIGRDITQRSKGKIKGGIGISGSANSITISVGPSAGFSVSRLQDDVAGSISLTDEQAQWVNDVAGVPAEMWQVDSEFTTSWVENGNVVGKNHLCRQEMQMENLKIRELIFIPTRVEFGSPKSIRARQIKFSKELIGSDIMKIIKGK